MQFSIVTPTSNSERYLAETIESVIYQRGDFEIQYVIADNCSSDGTLEIAERYQRFLNTETFRAACRKVSLDIVSERDKGMYDAINKGFARTSGCTMAWINSDDMYLQGAFSAVARALSDVADVKWLKGITSYMNEKSEIVHGGQCFLYDRRWIEGGYCGPVFPFIQQDSVFWRRDLWDRVGGCDASFKLAGDYMLWCSFSRFEPLYSFGRYLSCFRRSSAQLSLQIEKYWNEAQTKHSFPGLMRNSSLRWCLTARVLPLWMKIAARRHHFGVEEFHALVENGNGWCRLREGKVPTRSRAIQDRANSAVLL